MKSSRKTLLFLIPLLVCLALAVGAFLFSTRYVLLEGHIYPTEVQELDLRGSDVSRVEGFSRLKDLKRLDLRGCHVPVEDCFALQAELPDCDIFWDITLNGTAYDSHSETVTMENVPEDWENLRYFPSLRQVEFTRCTDPAAAENVADALPGAAVLRNYALAGSWYPYDTGSVSLEASQIDPDAVCSQLVWFRDMKTVTVTNGTIPADTIRSLRSAFPAVSFDWLIPVGGCALPEDVAALPRDGMLPALSDVEDVLDLLPALRSIDLTDSGFDPEEAVVFRENHPDIDLRWTVELFGQTYDSGTAELDLTGHRLTDTAELEAAFALLPELTYVDLTDCGLPDEVLGDLNARWEDIDIVWTLYFRNYALRTDAKYFIPSSTENLQGLPLGNGDLDILRYCTRLEGLDLGHQYFDDLSFLYYTPHIKYLILVECPISDITPIGSLRDLVYAELFATPINDLTPLVNCTALDSLNISYIDCKQDGAWSALSQMTWLRRLWYCNTPLSGAQIRQLEANGTTVFHIQGGEPTGGTWRYDQAYYDMRDFFEMWYMPGGTNGLDEDGNQIIIDDYGEEYHLEDWDLTQRWWELPQFSGLNVHIWGITY